MSTHSAFRTATVIVAGGGRVDLAASRQESYRRPAALPEVTPADLERDLWRRDFTVNALAASLDPGRFGEVVDLVGGIEDLRAGTIRVLHGLSFIDDPTRAFRAVRLALRLSFEIDSRTERLIRVALRRGVFEALSAARLRREWVGLLETSDPAAAVRSMTRLGLQESLDRGWCPSRRVYPRLARVPGVLEWYGALAEPAPVREWLVPLCVLLAGEGAVRVARITERLRPGRRERAVLERSATVIAQVLKVLSTAPRPSRIHAVCRDRPAELLLASMAVTGRERERRLLASYFENLRGVRLEIDGRSLLAAGVPAGPGLARGWRRPWRAKLDGRAPTAARQLRIALRAARRA